MSKAQDILEILADFRQRPESQGVQLRLNLAELLIRQLRAKGWTQRQLADTAVLKESYVSRVFHSDANCTFETAGRLLFALGIKAELAVSDKEPAVLTELGTEIDTIQVIRFEDYAHGEEVTQEIQSTTPDYRIAKAAN